MCKFISFIIKVVVFIDLFNFSQRQSTLSPPFPSSRTSNLHHYRDSSSTGDRSTLSHYPQPIRVLENFTNYFILNRRSRF